MRLVHWRKNFIPLHGGTWRVYFTTLVSAIQLFRTISVDVLPTPIKKSKDLTIVAPGRCWQHSNTGRGWLFCWQDTMEVCHVLNLKQHLGKKSNDPIIQDVLRQVEKD